jgi:hypothetical protein
MVIIPLGCKVAGIEAICSTCSIVMPWPLESGRNDTNDTEEADARLGGGGRSGWTGGAADASVRTRRQPASRATAGRGGALAAFYTGRAAHLFTDGQLLGWGAAIIGAAVLVGVWGVARPRR